MTQVFEWDADKNERNIEKHGIDFADAAQLFAEEYLSYVSPRNNEERMVGIGKLRDRIIAVAYTLRASNIRIISARVARRTERKLYMQWSKKNKDNE